MSQDNSKSNWLQEQASEKERVQRLINTEFLRLQKVRKHRYFVNLATKQSMQIDDVDMIDHK